MPDHHLETLSRLYLELSTVVGPECRTGRELALERECARLRGLADRALPYLWGIVSIDAAPTMDGSARPGFRADDGRKHNHRRPAKWWDELQSVRLAMERKESPNADA